MADPPSASLRSHACSRPASPPSLAHEHPRSRPGDAEAALSSRRRARRVRCLVALEPNTHRRDGPAALKSFADHAAEAIWLGETTPELPPSIHRTALRKLRQRDAAVTLNDLRLPPPNKLHALKAERSGQQAIWINDQDRLCFRWDGRDAHDVEITDDHSSHEKAQAHRQDSPRRNPPRRFSEADGRFPLPPRQRHRTAAPAHHPPRSRAARHFRGY